MQKKGFTVFLSNEKLPENLLLNRCLALTADIVEESNMFSVKNKIVLKDCYGKLVYSSGEGKSKEKDYKKGYQEAIRRAYTTMTDVEYKEVKGAILLPVKKTVIPVVKVSIPVKKSNLTKQLTLLIKVETLYAQAKPNGFQLVNTTPAIVFKILKTNIKDVFVIKGKDGLIYKKEIFGLLNIMKILN